VDALFKRPGSQARPVFFLSGARPSTAHHRQQALPPKPLILFSAVSTVAASAAVFLYLLRLEKAVK
jgi:hypothetical protein